MMDFGNLKSIEKANTKVGSKRGQNWSFRFKRADTKNGVKSAFYISDTLWDQLDLDNKGMKQYNNVVDGEITQVYLGVVENDDAIFLKRTNKLKEGASKGKNFKAVVLEEALATVSLIDPESFENQFLTLEHEGEQDGVNYYLIQSGEGTVGLDHITGAGEAESSIDEGTVEQEVASEEPVTVDEEF